MATWVISKLVSGGLQKTVLHASKDHPGSPPKHDLRDVVAGLGLFLDVISRSGLANALSLSLAKGCCANDLLMMAKEMCSSQGGTAEVEQSMPTYRRWW